MTDLVCYVDNEHNGGWAKIQMDNGNHCWVEVSKGKILVKHSSLFGVKMYQERNEQKAKHIAHLFSKKFPDRTPHEMRHPVLKPIVNSILHCGSLAEATMILNAPYS